AYVFQEPRLLNNLTALENVTLTLGNTKNAAADAERWLKKMGLENHAKKIQKDLQGIDISLLSKNKNTINNVENFRNIDLG
ncbi:MAG: hypothetical protein J6U64_05850, partial [Alphaproteobacteria bacterium]|nr:hypothetical protein [Alphaproteobacteria bacterium]